MYDIAVHRKHGMQGRMHTFIYRVVLLSIGHCLRFFFVITKNVLLQLFHNFIFELRVLIGMGCLGWFEDTRYSFDKSCRYEDVWCTRDSRRVGFRQSYTDSLDTALIRAGHVRQDCWVRSYK